MDCQDYIAEPAERKKGQHLQREERGAIQHLRGQGYSNRTIAREIRPCLKNKSCTINQAMRS